jgi:hypothetical protein
MKMSENRRRVLDMLAEGKISVDEAERLLTAMGESAEEAEPSVAGETRKGERKYLRIVVEPEPDAGSGLEQRRVNVRVPMALIRAGMKFTSLIPPHATDQINENLKRHGVDLDIRDIKLKDIESLVDAMKDFEIDVQGGQEGTVKVYFE